MRCPPFFITGNNTLSQFFERFEVSFPKVYYIIPNYVCYFNKTI